MSEGIGYDIILGALKETTFQKDIDSPTYNILLKRLLDNRISKPVTLAEKKYRISALNTLFRKDLISKHTILFDEEKVGHADVIFTTQAYKVTKKPIVYEKDALYQKYVRNDPIKKSFCKPRVRWFHLLSYWYGRCYCFVN